MYGLTLWGCTNKNNVKVFQSFQNKVLRRIVNALCYIRNADLHRDLDIEEVCKEILKFAAAHNLRLRRHANEQASSHVQTVGSERRLQRVRFPISMVIVIFKLFSP